MFKAGTARTGPGLACTITYVWSWLKVYTWTSLWDKAPRAVWNEGVKATHTYTHTHTHTHLPLPCHRLYIHAAIDGQSGTIASERGIYNVLYAAGGSEWQ